MLRVVAARVAAAVLGGGGGNGIAPPAAAVRLAGRRQLAAEAGGDEPPSSASAEQQRSAGGEGEAAEKGAGKASAEARHEDNASAAVDDAPAADQPSTSGSDTAVGPPADDGVSGWEEYLKVVEMKRPKKPSRKQRGSYKDGGLAEELEAIEALEGDMDRHIRDLYDARGLVIPEHYDENDVQWQAFLADCRALAKHAEELDKKFPIDAEDPNNPKVLHWKSSVVIQAGGDSYHPGNKKVELTVYLRDLKLSPEEQTCLKALAGSRYNPNNDKLRLVGNRYHEKEQNRRDVVRILDALLKASKDPALQQEAAALQLAA